MMTPDTDPSCPPGVPSSPYGLDVAPIATGGGSSALSSRATAASIALSQSQQPMGDIWSLITPINVLTIHL